MPYGLAPDFKAVLFDVDGTLIDSLPALIQGLGDAYEHFNGQRPSDAEILELIGMPLREQMKLFREIPPTEAELSEMVSYTIAAFEANKHLEREYAAAIEALIACHEAGLKTAFVTSKSAAELKGFLPRFRAAQYANTIVCASDVANPKPHPECALLACQKLRVDPSEAVYVGDSVFDLRSARGAGICSVAVAYGAGRREDLEAEMPDLIFDTPEELLSWIRESIYKNQHAPKEETRTT